MKNVLELVSLLNGMFRLNGWDVAVAEGQLSPFWQSGPITSKFTVISVIFFSMSNCRFAFFCFVFTFKDWAKEDYSGGCPVNVMAPGLLTYYHPSLRKPCGR